jgi:methylated-DNA-protein-cysteine methyltransferase related protein
MTDQSRFFDQVLEVVARIPPGRVTTYGLIARHLGRPNAARTVGWALNGGSGAGLPCHRVVNRLGALSGRMSFGNPFVMEDLLRSEGVVFRDDGSVRIDLHLWDPAGP